MDRNTLGHYGWLVACILVIAIMITLATPFATVIRNGVAEYVDNFKGVATDALDGIGSDTSFGGGGSGLPDDPSEDEPEDSTATVSGADYLYLTDVSETPHNLNVSLTSDTITDFSGVTVTRTGKNLINLNDIIDAGKTKDLTVDNDSNTLSFVKTTGPSTSSGAYLDVYLSSGSYSLSLYNYSDAQASLIVRYDSTLVYNSSATEYSKTLERYTTTFDATESGVYRIFFMASSIADVDTNINLSNIQLELGSATDFEPFTSQSATASADGTVNGLTSISPNVVLIADNSEVNISCEYQKKTNL